jgi:hypothetical protein
LEVSAGTILAKQPKAHHLPATIAFGTKTKRYASSIVRQGRRFETRQVLRKYARIITNAASRRTSGSRRIRAHSEIVQDYMIDISHRKAIAKYCRKSSHRQAKTA